MKYAFEVYTKNPETGEGGWDIEVGWVKADNLDDARKLVKKNIPLFDVFIQIYEANMNARDYGRENHRYINF